MTTQSQIDQARLEAFGDRMIANLSGAAATLFASVGHQTGLFDTMAQRPPCTSEELAEATGLHERYVREWLGAVTVTGIVEYDATTRTYHLPAEHAPFVTRAGGPDNLAFFAQYLRLVTHVERDIVECFRKGGGVPYSKFPEFQVIQGEETARVYDAALVPEILPLVPGLPERLEQGIDAVDIGTGVGHAVNVMAKAYPNSRFTGYDLSDEGVEIGRKEAADWGLTNARFEAVDLAHWDEPEAFDLITAFDVIHDQAWPRKVLANTEKALRPGGTYLMGDMAASSNLEENVENPMAPLLYMFSLFHCMTVSLAQGGEGLGTVWGIQKAKELLAEAGFTDIDTKQVEGDILNVYYICQK